MALFDIVRGPDGVPVASRSGLAASLCGHRYNELYNKGVADESGFSLRGSGYHKVKLCYINRLLKAGTPMDFDEAGLAFQEGIALANTPVGLIPEVHDIWQRHVQHFELRLENFLGAENRRAHPEIPVAEVPYEFGPDLEYGWPETNTIEMLDDKSYFVAFDEDHARMLLQTRFYIWAAMREYPGFENYRFTYNFVRLNKTASVRFTKDDWSMLDTEIRAMDRTRRLRHANNDWQAFPGDPCGFCNLACPIMDDPNLGNVRVTNGATAQVNGGQILVLQKKLAGMKTAQQRYCTVNGSVEVNGVTFAHRPIVKKSYPIDAVTKVLTTLGVPVIATVSASALKKQAKLAPALLEDLAPSELRKETARFSAKSNLQDFADAQNDEDE